MHHSLARVICSLIALAFCLGLGLPSASAQFEDEFGGGLIATYRPQHGNEFQRVDAHLSFAWAEGSPDPRIGDGGFAVHWDGLLLTKQPGPYTLRVLAKGKVRISLAGEVLLDAAADEPTWLSAKPIPLQFDWHPLVVEFENTGDAPRLALFWEGPGFPLEPVPDDHLFHDIESTLESPFERGQQLLAAHRCGSCHNVAGLAEPPRGPALTKLDGNLSEPWLLEWLTQKALSDDDTSIRRMPHYNLSEGEAKAVAEYLLSQSDRRKAETKLPQKANRGVGETLFNTLGCLACHQNGELGSSDLFSGPNLTEIGQKRPAAYFETWLKNPAQLNADHRMPVYDLSAKERGDLAAYLASLTPAGKQARTPVRKFNETLIREGREIIAKNQCNACHNLPGEMPETAAQELRPLGPGDLWHDACLAEPTTTHPGYALAESDREAIKTYIREMARAGVTETPKVSGKWVMTERNCVACHPRGTNGGLADTAQSVVDLHASLTSQLPAMQPPSLNSVGDKLHDESLARAIRRDDKGYRPWLKVRMPKYNLSEEELKAIIGHLVTADRIPEGAPTKPRPSPPSADAMMVAGARLVTTDGFGCTSCHQVGDMQPPKAPLNAMGPNLSGMGDRMRKSWFHRWVNNPARIVPRMEMPSVQVPVKGVLDEDLDAQLAAVWHVLNTPGFQPPKPDPVRIVRHTGLPDDAARPVVLTDVMKLGKKVYVKPLLVGLPNRHNVMFDLETASLTAWWMGDAAWQRSEGKTWFWEPGGTDLWNDAEPRPEILLRGPTQRLVGPARQGQFFTEFDDIQYGEGQVTISYRLHFADDDVPTIRVRQTFAPRWDEDANARHGFRRTLEITGVPEGFEAGIRLVPTSQLSSAQLDVANYALRFTDRGGLTIQGESAGKLRLDQGGTLWLEESNDQVTLNYDTALPRDIFPPQPTPDFPQPERTELDVVPGWTATNLPLPSEIMPTALAWRPDGRLIVASLKGRLWEVTDSTDDGWENSVRQVGDEFAAPFGLKAYEDHIDVINKYGLLRLYEQDGQVTQVQNIASGWGHTDDYHDWAVGLPLDKEGNYHIAVSCQQDDRTEAAAKWRGSVLKLTPRKPTDDNPQLFDVKEVTAGNRFPVGIAQNRGGDLFVTDNQGNWKPFNELNRVIPGKRYGFLNKLERKPGFNPEKEPPAVNIPHPWTRSVNGICFLETPADLRDQIGYDLFGPFEGDLIGCEYDTRRLVRMSLDKVGDTVQGAVYPFTPDPGNDPRNALQGPITCAVAPHGDLYIGNIRDAGWGGSNNIGSITRLRPSGTNMPPGIAKVTATPRGLKIRFTQQVDPAGSRLPSNYNIASYTRESTPAYGGSDIDRRVERIDELIVSDDRLEVELTFEEMRPGFVYEIYLNNEIAGKGKTLWPAEAHYTLNKLPTE